MSGSCNDCNNHPCVCGMDQAGSELSAGLGTLGHALVIAIREKPVKPGLAFKAGDRVMLTTMANSYYGGVGGYTPVGQGGGKPGTVRYAGDRPYSHGADPRPYFVDWDNGASNSYREGDLKPA